MVRDRQLRDATQVKGFHFNSPVKLYKKKKEKKNNKNTKKFKDL